MASTSKGRQVAIIVCRVRRTAVVRTVLSGVTLSVRGHTHSYPAVPVPVTYEVCGIHETGTSGSHYWVSCPTNSSGQNCSVGGYYVCQNHNHSYPAVPVPVTYEVCGIHETGTSGSHYWVSCPTNSSGQNCSVGGYYACQSHNHSYPAPRVRADIHRAVLGITTRCRVRAVRRVHRRILMRVNRIVIRIPPPRSSALRIRGRIVVGQCRMRRHARGTCVLYV